jgi:hypothetical protein
MAYKLIDGKIVKEEEGKFINGASRKSVIFHALTEQVSRAEAAESALAAERAAHETDVQVLQRRVDFLERRCRELTRQNLSEWEAETPFGQALDGGGDEVQE